METNSDTHNSVTLTDHNLWDSRINVFPGSCETSGLSDRSEFANDEQLNEADRRDSVVSSFASEHTEDELNWSSDSVWPDIEIPGSWGSQALEEKHWNDEDKPYFRVRRYEDLQLNQVEKEGVLTDRIIAACSSYLDRSPEIGRYVLCKVRLHNKSLTNIDILRFHHYLQNVDLSGNKLAEVDALGQLPFLMYLNVAYNRLTKVLNFKAPFNLTFANFAHNNISEIDDLTEFWSLVHLDISFNSITVIAGLEKLRYLRHLNLAHNKIEKIQNLNNLRLQTLDLQHNKIASFESGDHMGLKTLNDILTINVSHNCLNTLWLFKEVSGLQALNASYNHLNDLMQITYLQNLTFLTEVDFRGNPFISMDCYLEVCVHSIKSIFILDGEVVEAHKKVLVRHKFEPSATVYGFRKSARILLLEQINDPYVGAPIVPVDQPSPPIIVLVGPPASNKGKLVRAFCKENPRFTILGVNHTTRNQTEDEVNDEAYHFISSEQFCSMAQGGEFLAVSQTLGQYFGFARSEIRKTVGNTAVMVVHMNIGGALALRARGLNCVFVLAMSKTIDTHRNWLIKKYYNWQESDKYYGAVEVENCPEKAEEFLSEYGKIQRIVAEDIVAEILNDLLNKVTKTNRSHVNVEHCGRNRMTTAGILKDPFQRKTPNQPHSRSSVTFQDESSMDLQQVQTRASCRLVTFSQTSTKSESNLYTGTPLALSISGIVVRGAENKDSSNLFCFLSQNRRESVDPSSISWDVQAEALNAAVEEIVNYRPIYIDLNYSNPGLFMEVVYTDDFDDALVKLKRLLKNCVKSQARAKPNYHLEKDPLYGEMLNSRLNLLKNDIKSQMSVSHQQFDAVRPGTTQAHDLPERL